MSLKYDLEIEPGCGGISFCVKIDSLPVPMKWGNTPEDGHPAEPVEFHVVSAFIGDHECSSGLRDYLYDEFEEELFELVYEELEDASAD